MKCLVCNCSISITCILTLDIWVADIFWVWTGFIRWYSFPMAVTNVIIYLSWRLEALVHCSMYYVPSVQKWSIEVPWWTLLLLHCVIAAVLGWWFILASHKNSGIIFIACVTGFLLVSQHLSCIHALIIFQNCFIPSVHDFSCVI